MENTPFIKAGVCVPKCTHTKEELAKEWKTFYDWMYEKRLVVMRGEKGTYKDGKYYFHRSQVQYSKFHPLYELVNNERVNQSIDYAHRYGDKGWFLGVEWERWD